MSDRPASLDLAVIGNCSIASLIDLRGRHVFTCLPRLDGDPVFCRLLDDGKDRGYFDVELTGCVRSSQQYLRNTAIVETRLEAADGAAVRILDFCPRFRQFDRMFHPMMIVRIVEVAAGRPRVRVRMRPRQRYGEAEYAVRRGSHHLRYIGDALDLRLTTNTSLDYIVEERWFALEDPLTLVLGPDESIAESVDGLGARFLASTTDYWRDWVRTLAVPSRVVVNNAETCIACCLAGLGLIQIPRFDVLPLLQAGKLVEVLPDDRAASMDIAFLYPHRRQRSRRLLAFVEWFEELVQPHLE